MWKVAANCPQELNISSIPSPDKSSLTIWTHNLGTLKEMDIDSITTQFIRINADVVILLDTRLTPQNQNWIGNRFRQSLRRHNAMAYKLFFFPAHQLDKKPLVGGQIILVSHRLRKLESTTIVHRGIAAAITGLFGNTIISIIGTYWPVHNTSGPLSLWNQTCDMLQTDNPIGEIKNHIEVFLAGLTGNVILTGDFNSSIGESATDKYDVMNWITSLNLMHASDATTLLRPSFSNSAFPTKKLWFSRIDYAFWKGPDILSQFSSPYKPKKLWSDHRPLLSCFQFKESVPKENKLYLKLIPDVGRKDRKIMEAMAKFDAKLENLVEGDSLSVINFINKRTVEICNRIMISRIKRIRKKGHDGWSPETSALQIQLDSIIKAISGINGTAGREKWTPVNFKRKIKLLKSTWTQKLKSLSKSPEELLRWKCLDCHSWVHWTDIPWQHLPSFLETALLETKKKLHGRYRKSRREEFLSILHAEVKKADIGQTGDIIKRLKPKKIEHYGLDELAVDDRIIVDPKDIHSRLTDHFTHWYKIESTDGPALQDWNDLNCTLDVFLTKFAEEKIPAPILTALYSASRDIHIDPTVKSSFHLEMRTFMTFEEFDQRLDWEGPNTAGGVNGMSHNKMFHWGPNTRRQVYHALEDLWIDKVTPDDWRWRWLVPLPKTNNPTASQLRPLMLIDVLRKIITGFLTRKITNFWHKHKILSTCSHAFVGGQGTHTAELQLLNTMETCKEWRSKFYAASIDMMKAFDALERDFQIHALVRTGVPADIALYMIGMDYNAITVVRTPLAYQHWSQHGLSNLQHFGFFAEKGTAQGDKPSPCIWVAVNDILATAWDSITNGALYTQDDQGRIQKAHDIIYADDNLALSGTFSNLQLKMDLLSGFCNMYRIKISTTPGKSSAFLIQWGNHFRPDESFVLLHGKGWSPSPLPLQCNGTLKYLGVLWNMSTGNGEQLDTALQTIKAFCDHILVKKSSNNMKLMVLQRCLLMAINYFAKFTTWPLKDYLTIDKAVARYYRLLTLNKKDFPLRLLFASRQHGGLGLYRPTDLAHKAKLSLVLSLPLLGHSNMHTISSLVSRGFRLNGLGTNTGRAWLSSKVVETCWVGSLIEWLGSLNLELERNSSLNLHPSSQNIAPTPGSDLHLDLALNGIVLNGELNTEHPTQSIVLRPGQCWKWPHSETIIEIIGFDSLLHSTSVIEWKLDGSDYFLDEPNHCLGAGAEQWICKEVWLDNPPNTLAQLSGERFHRNGTTRASVTSLLLRSSSWPTLDVKTSNFPHSFIFNNESDLFSDGSFSPSPCALHRLSLDPPHKASGAIIQNGTLGNCVGIRIEKSTNSHHGVYFMELLALTCSITSIKNANLTNVKAAADCLAAINMAKRAIIGHTKLTKCFHLVSSLLSTEAIEIRHVRAHPERRLPDKLDWTPDDWGIFMADRLAGDDNTPDLTVDEDWVLRELTACMEFRIVRSSNHSIFHEDIDRLLSTSNMKAYIKERNTSRNLRLNLNDHRWSSDFLPLINIMHDNKVSTTAWATTLRLVWDKAWHGANQAKAPKADVSSDRCRHCSDYEDQAHIILSCCKGNDLRQTLYSNLQDVHSGSLKVDLLSRVIAVQASTNHTLWTGAPDNPARCFLREHLDNLPLTSSEWAALCTTFRLLGDAARAIQINHCLPCKTSPQPTLPFRRHSKRKKPMSSKKNLSLFPKTQSTWPKKGEG